MYLSQRGLTKEALRATLGLTVMTSISLRVIAFLATGLLLDPQVWFAALFVLPATLAGIFLARRIYVSISREALLRLIALLLVGSGGSLVWRALAQM